MTPSRPRDDLMAPPLTVPETAAGTTVPALIERQVRAAPQQVAVVCGHEQLTYEALDRQASQFASLLQSRGVQSGDIVAICVERGLHRIVGLLGILKCGAAYLPLDPDYPDERLHWMLTDSRARLLVTETRFQPRFAETTAPAILIDESSATDSSPTEVRLDLSITGESLCYVIYTSGSTGRPKGVAVSHRAAVHLVWQPDFVEFDTSDCFLHHTSMSFDPSVFEIWTPLVNGGRLVVADPGRTSLTGLGRAIRKHGVTILQVATPLFHALVDECLDDLRALKAIVSGGEAFSLEHVRRALGALPETRLSLCYGPTENAAITTCYQPGTVQDLTGLDFVPLGRSLAGTEVFVLDDRQQPVSPGNVGELYCGGAGLAAGYLDRPELTAERFPELEVNHRRLRLYRTGDLVRVHEHGHLQFLGRTDHQVKIRGFRVELGEVESLLRRHPAVRECVVLATSDASRSSSLAAWLKQTPGTSLTRPDLQKFLGQFLPKSMLPEHYYLLTSWPLTPNGKIDRARLLELRETTLSTRDALAAEAIVTAEGESHV